jgi:ornithine cyclodeaminase
MAGVYSRTEIERVIDPVRVIEAMERAFSAYSRGEAVIPPVGQLDFEDPPGDCHIKYGYLTQGSTFTVKIATGFWKNPERGIPSSNGVVMLFSKHTGELLTIFQDEGYLTDCRTAAAGAVAAKYLAPATIDRIAIIGAGLQARMQLDYLRHVTSCRRVSVWARSLERARLLDVPGFDIDVCPSARDAVAGAQLIVTTTASRAWLIGAEDVPPGAHITAVGADGGGKQELDPRLFARAAVRAVDSVAQCAQFGDSSHAIAEGLIKADELIEIGRLIENAGLRRQTQNELTIADLTGVAVQDIAIAELALQGLQSGGRHNDPCPGTEERC